jgi:hypothetical protein
MTQETSVILQDVKLSLSIEHAFIADFGTFSGNLETDDFVYGFDRILVVEFNILRLTRVALASIVDFCY